MKNLIAAFLLLGCGSAWAIPVQWTLTDVTFDDGQTLEGGFTYDASADTYSDVYMYASDLFLVGYSDSPLPPFVIFNWLGSSTATNLSAESWHDGLGKFRLNLEFASALTNAGGAVNFLPTSGELNYGCCPESPFYERFIVSGTVSAVPIPAAVWLFGSALAGLGWMRRRQTA